MTATLNVFCTICSEQYNTEESVLTTSCGHIFHNACFDSWKNRNSTCPECRKTAPNTHRIYLNVLNVPSPDPAEPSTSQYNLVKRISLLESKLEENEKNFFDAQLALSAAEKRVSDLNSMLEIKKARVESYDQTLQELTLNLDNSEKNLLNSLGELAKTESALQQKKPDEEPKATTSSHLC